MYGFEGVAEKDYLAEQVFQVRFNDVLGVSHLASYTYARVTQAEYTPQNLSLDEPDYLIAHDRLFQWTDHARFTARSGETVRILVEENDVEVVAIQMTPVGEVRVEFDALFAIPPTREEAREWRVAERSEE